MLLSMWKRLELGKGGSQGSLCNRLDQSRGDPRVCFTSHKFIHLGLSDDSPLEFRVSCSLNSQPISQYRKDESLLKSPSTGAPE